MSKWRNKYENVNSAETSEEEPDKIKEIQMCIDASKAEVSKAINKTIQRGDKLEDLENQAECLQDEAEIFNRSTRGIRRRMCWQYIKSKMLFALVVIALMLIIYFVFIHPLVKK
eukprot:119979_1